MTQIGTDKKGRSRPAFFISLYLLYLCDLRFIDLRRVLAIQRLLLRFGR